MVLGAVGCMNNADFATKQQVSDKIVINVK